MLLNLIQNKSQNVASVNWQECLKSRLAWFYHRITNTADPYVTPWTEEPDLENGFIDQNRDCTFEKSD